MPAASLINSLRQFFAHYPETLVCAYLYGSQARGTASPASDVDLAVLYPTDPPDTLDGLGLDWVADLEQQLGRIVYGQEQCIDKPVYLELR